MESITFEEFEQLSPNDRYDKVCEALKSSNNTNKLLEYFIKIYDHPGTKLEENDDIKPFESSEFFTSLSEKLSSDDLETVSLSGYSIGILSRLSPILEQLISSGVVDKLLDVMKSNIDNALIQRRCLRGLNTITYKVENKEPIVELILTSMKTHENDPEVIKNACHAFYGFTALGWYLDIITKQDGIAAVMDALHKHKSDAGVAAKASIVLYHWTEKFDSNRQEVAKRGGIDLAIEIIQKFPDDFDVMKGASSLLWSLSIDEDNANTIREKEGFDVVVNLMKLYRKEPFDVIRHCHGVIYNLSSFDDIKERISKEGIIEISINDLKELKKDYFLVKNICGTFLLLATKDNYRAELGEKGAIEAILTSIKGHTNKFLPKVADNALGALWNLSFNEKNRTIFAANGAATTIIDFMNIFQNDSNSLANGCGALRNFARGAENISTIAKNGGIEVIVNSMKAYPNHPGIQKTGTGALRNLSVNDTYLGDIGKKGGISVLITAANNYKNDIVIVKNAIGALCNLGSHNPNNSIIVEEGGIPIVVSVLGAHQKDSEIAANGCGILWQLATEAENYKKLGETIPTVITMLKVHSKDTDVIRNALNVLRHIAMDGENEIAIGKADGFDVIFETLKNYQKDEDQLETILATLYNLSENPGNQTIIMMNEGMELVLGCIKSFPKNEGILKFGWNILKDLNGEVSAQVEFTNKHNGVEALLDTWKMHQKNETISEITMITFYKISTNATIQLKLADKGVIDPIIEVMRSHRANGKIIQNAFGSLTNVNGFSIKLKADIVSKGIMDDILIVMKNHISNVEVQAQTLALLVNLASNESLRKTLKKAKDSVKEVMKRHTNESNIQKLGKEYQSLMPKKFLFF